MNNRSMMANVALVLVAIGWVLASYGVLSMLGDPSPTVPRAQIKAHMAAARHISVALLLIGVQSLAMSLWLAGCSFSAARIRSSCTLAAFIIPATVIIANLF
jgi:hypothetical protein